MVGPGRLPLALVSTLHVYNHLAHIYAPIAIAVAVIVFGVFFFAALRYRRPADQAASWFEAVRLEATYAIVLVCIAGFLLYETFTAEHQVDTVANAQRPALTINVVAAKWEWAFTYPAYGITVHAGTTGNVAFWVPANQPVRFAMQSVDVIHALWLPTIRYKRALIPGATSYQTLVFPSGLEQGHCNVYCGLHHSDMIFKVNAVSQAQFVAWTRRERARPT